MTTSIDRLLIFLATFALTLALLPEKPAHQTIVVRSGQGKEQQYSLSTEDPRLDNIVKSIKERSDIRPSGKLALARWQAEVAEQYSQQRHKSEVVQVTFVEGRQVGQVTSVWLQLGRKFRQQANQLEQQAAEQQATRSQISLGEPVARGHSMVQHLTAVSVSVLVLLAFQVWNHRQPAVQFFPPISEPSPKDATVANANRNETVVALSIPADWVQIKQPWGVRIRQSSFALLVVGSCVVAAMSFIGRHA